MASGDSGKHRWSFSRVGGIHQVVLQSAEDLAALPELDQKLWLALSCPVNGLDLDPATLKLVDTDGDGHIRAPEVLAAVRWTLECLRDPEGLLQGKTTLPLSAINDQNPEGKNILAAAREILTALEKPQATTIGPEDTTDTTRIFSKTRFNGDGVVPASASEDPEIAAAIEDIMAGVGSKTDRSGLPGIDRELVEQFFKEAQALSDWYAAAEKDPKCLPLGERSMAAFDALEAVAPKVEDFFVRCKLASFDPRAAAALNREEKEYLALGTRDLTLDTPDVAALPLSRVEPDRALPLLRGVNPAWAGRLLTFHDEAVVPLLGEKAEIGEADWRKLKSAFADHAAWRKTKPATRVEKLELSRIRMRLRPGTRSAIEQLIEKDLARAPEFNALAAVDRLVRYHRDLYRLLKNFVSFEDFYGRERKAVFQAGTLYIDQRACDLCIRVEDVGKHAATAHRSQTCLLYCDCTRQGSGEKLSIAAAMTAGDSDNLMVGRNGVFYDRQGRDWDASVVRIIENPISIRQAFWSPYKRLVRFISEMVAKRAAAADSAVHEKTTVIVTGAASGEPAKAPLQKPKIDIGTVAALGVAVGGITAALGAFLQAFFGLGIWIPLGLVGLVLLISGPSMIIAWLKLRQRNLGPILDACGWAVNTRAMINLPFGRSLTSQAKLPPGARVQRADPFKPRHFKRNLVMVLGTILVLGALWFFGLLDRILPAPIRSTEVMGEIAPAAEAAPASAPAPAPAEAPAAKP